MRKTHVLEGSGQSRVALAGIPCVAMVFFFFILVTGPRRSLSFKLSDTRVYAP